jgi:hypothetical protein
MPTYDYRCQADGQVYEVKHPMSVRLSTWGELRQWAPLDGGDISDDTPVTRVLSTGGVVRSQNLKTPEAPPCMSGQGCCGAGNCGF